MQGTAWEQSNGRTTQIEDSLQGGLTSPVPQGLLLGCAFQLREDRPPLLWNCCCCCCRSGCPFWIQSGENVNSDVKPASTLTVWTADVAAAVCCARRSTAIIY